MHGRARGQPGDDADAIRVMVDGAFLARALERVEAVVMRADHGAMRCYRAAGFSCDGVVREYDCGDGRFADCAIWSVLRSEWQKKRGKR